MRRYVAALLLVVFVLGLGAASAMAIEGDEPWSSEDRGTTMEKILAWVISFPLQMVEKVGEAGGFETLDKLVFMEGISDEERQRLPWSEGEARQVFKWYWILAVVTAPFYGVVIAATAIRLIQAGANGRPQEREEAMEGLQRWVLAIVLVAVMPLLVRGLLWITSILVYAISSGFGAVASDRGIADWGQVSLTQMNFSTGSIFGTVILKVFFAGMYFYLNVLYIIRKITLSVMLCFTPMAAILWSINKKTTAISIWLGELASNAFMPVAHGLVLCTILAICDIRDTQNTWLTLLISLFVLIPTAEAIRNSMMSIIARLGGVSEERTAMKVMGAAAGLGSVIGLGRAASATIGGAGSGGIGNLPLGGGGTGGLSLGGSGISAATRVPSTMSSPRTTASMPATTASSSILSGVKHTTTGTYRKVGGAASAITGVVTSAVPGGEVTSAVLGATVGAMTGVAHGGAKLAWEVAKNPQGVSQEITGGARQIIERGKGRWEETKQAGKNIGAVGAGGVRWAGGKISPRYAAYTHKSKIK